MHATISFKECCVWFFFKKRFISPFSYSVYLHILIVPLTGFFGILNIRPLEKYRSLLHRYECFSIRNYIRDTSEIFSISSLVKISLASFLCFSFIFPSLGSLVTYFFPLEDKLHMFAPPCNILYLLLTRALIFASALTFFI